MPIITFNPVTNFGDHPLLQGTHGDLTQIFPTFPNAMVNLDIHMKMDPWAVMGVK
jgi:hypothetical protein